MLLNAVSKIVIGVYKGRLEVGQDTFMVVYDY